MTDLPGTRATTSAQRASQKENTPLMKISSISRESDWLRTFVDQSTNAESPVTYRTVASLIDDIVIEDSDIPLRCVSLVLRRGSPRSTLTTAKPYVNHSTSSRWCFFAYLLRVTNDIRRTAHGVDVEVETFLIASTSCLARGRHRMVRWHQL